MELPLYAYFGVRGGKPTNQLTKQKLLLSGGVCLILNPKTHRLRIEEILIKFRKQIVDGFPI